MQTKIMYLKGSFHDEALLNEAAKQGYKLQSVVQSQGQIVGYLVREPWAAAPRESFPLKPGAIQITPREDLQNAASPSAGAIPEMPAASNYGAAKAMLEKEQHKNRKHRR